MLSVEHTGKTSRSQDLFQAERKFWVRADPFRRDVTTPDDVYQFVRKILLQSPTIRNYVGSGALSERHDATSPRSRCTSTLAAT